MWEIYFQMERNYMKKEDLKPRVVIVIILLLFILTANGFSLGGSGTTGRHNTQITRTTQNSTTIKRNTAHKTTHTQ
jgi:hypothetical protein